MAGVPSEAPEEMTRPVQRCGCWLRRPHPQRRSSCCPHDSRQPGGLVWRGGQGGAENTRAGVLHYGRVASGAVQSPPLSRAS